MRKLAAKLYEFGYRFPDEGRIHGRAPDRTEIDSTLNASMRLAGLALRKVCSAKEGYANNRWYSSLDFRPRGRNLHTIESANEKLVTTALDDVDWAAVRFIGALCKAATPERTLEFTRHHGSVSPIETSPMRQAQIQAFAELVEELRSNSQVQSILKFAERQSERQPKGFSR